MRALALALLLLLVAVAMPRPAAAPGMTTHLEPVTGTLGPSQSRTLPPLTFDGAPLVGGWVFLLQARTNGTLSAQLSIGGYSKTWTIPASNAWVGTTVLPADGFYNLTLSNPGPGSVAYAVYYDQSCNCVSKGFPVDLVAQQLVIPSGYMLFDADVAGPSAVSAEFAKPAALTLKIVAATMAQPGGVWPSDFTSLGSVETPVQVQAAPGIPPVWLYNLTVSVPQAARVYYFVQAGAFDPGNASQATAALVSFRAYITPQITPQVFPWPLVLGGAAAALAVVGGVILWRGRERPHAKDDERAKKGSKGKGARKAARPRGGGRGGARKRTSRGHKRRT